MILATDVYYHDAGGAKAAGVLFENWDDPIPKYTITVDIDKVEDYEPGSFYKRELPCLKELIKEAVLTHQVLIDTVIVDGFVTLGDDDRDGLGMHLYRESKLTLSVVGVAKTPYDKTPDRYRVMRGNSARPLYVTAVGMDLKTAQDHVRNMHGQYRTPTLLKLVDQLCRQP